MPVADLSQRPPHPTPTATFREWGMTRSGTYIISKANTQIQLDNSAEWSEGNWEERIISSDRGRV